MAEGDNEQEILLRRAAAHLGNADGASLQSKICFIATLASAPLETRLSQ